jgi:hypothetical protein
VHCEHPAFEQGLTDEGEMMFESTGVTFRSGISGDISLNDEKDSAFTLLLAMSRVSRAFKRFDGCGKDA